MSLWSVLGKIGKAGLNIATGGISGAIPGLGVNSGQPPSKLDSILNTASQVGGVLSANSAGRAKGRVDESTIQQAEDRVRLQAAQQAQQQIDDENARNLSESAGRNNFNLNENGQINDYNLSSAASKNNFGLNRVNAASTINGIDLAQRNFQLAAPGARASNAVRGDILSNAQDVSFAGLPKGVTVPTISGGLRPSMFSGATRALGTNMTNQALAGQEAGDTFAPLPEFPTYQDPKAFVGTDYSAPSPYIKGAPPVTATPLPQSGRADSIMNTASTVGALAPTFEQILAAYRKKHQPTTGSVYNGTTPAELGL